MHNDVSSAHGGFSTSAMSSPTPQDQQYSNGVVFPSLYSSIFSPKPSLPSDVEEVSDGSTAVDNSLYGSRLMLERQHLVDLHNLCLTHLHETAREAEALREENVNLRVVNRDLNKRLDLLVQASLQKHFVSNEYSSVSTVVNEFGRLCVGEKASGRRAWDEVSDESPTSVIENDQVERMDMDRVLLPKSISVRSTGYLKMISQGGESNGGPDRAPNRIRPASPSNGTQRVYVRGEKKEEEPLELEVHRQGMFKTELCNKWQQTGTCPYGDHCQFAHGILELRPVIRHPRYKTEVCRMVLAGDPCPYGHRCHFRHALTDQEKLMAMAPLKPARPMKLHR